MAKQPVRITGDQITTIIDDIFRSGGGGTRSKVYQQSARGFNILPFGNSTEPSRPMNGLVFFTRPALNLTYDNLSKDDRFLIYRDAPEWSVARMVRVFLDPLNQSKLADDRVKVRGNTWVGTEGNRGQVNSPLVDMYSPFIPFLSNRLMSLSGWPDTRLDYFASDKGLRNEQWIMADGIAEINEAFSLDATFRNDKGDGVLMLFNLWTKYQSAILDTMDPYPEMLATRELDYMTRIYVFVMDETMTYITHWAVCGAAFPTNISDGAIFNYDAEKTTKDALDQISIQFQCTGARYNDPIFLKYFNDLVGMFNPSLKLGYTGMDDYARGGQDNVPAGNKNDKPIWIKLDPSERQVMNFCAYPLINMVTMELEWWVTRKDYYENMVLRAPTAPGTDAHTRVGLDTQQYPSGVSNQEAINPEDVPKDNPFKTIVIEDEDPNDENEGS